MILLSFPSQSNHVGRPLQKPADVSSKVAANASEPATTEQLLPA